MQSNHYLLIASSDYALLSSKAESSLRSEGFEFIQNRTKDLVEFEVENPAYFRIVIQRRNEPYVSNFIMPSIKAARGSCLDVWFSPDQDDSSSQKALLEAKQFLRSLVVSLPVPPWEGLKFRESGKVKKKWKELLG